VIVYRYIWTAILLAVLQVGAQSSAVVDSIPVSSSSVEKVVNAVATTPAARSDSMAAAFKVAALSKILQGEAARQPAVPVNYQPPSIGKLFFRMFLGLMVVLGLIYALYRVARKARGMDVTAGQAPLRSLQVLETSFLGPNQKVVLMRLGTDRVLVVGSTPDQMRTLVELQGEEAMKILNQQRQQPITPAQFSETVNHLLRRFRKGGPA